jgi:hypothetical protein
MSASMRSLWTGWTRIAHRIGDAQARVLLTIVYFVVIGPFALPYRLLADPLRRAPEGPSFWMPRPVVRSTAITARWQH